MSKHTWNVIDFLEKIDDPSYYGFSFEGSDGAITLYFSNIDEHEKMQVIDWCADMASMKFDGDFTFFPDFSDV